MAAAAEGGGTSFGSDGLSYLYVQVIEEVSAGVEVESRSLLSLNQSDQPLSCRVRRTSDNTESSWNNVFQLVGRDP